MEPNVIDILRLAIPWICQWQQIMLMTVLKEVVVVVVILVVIVVVMVFHNT